MPFKLTVTEIRQNLSSRFYQRGRSYQRSGRVLVAEWDAETGILFGEVKGSGRNRYRQDILITPGRRRRIEGSCSCPVGYNCKHVAAVLLDWVEDNGELADLRKPQPPNELLLWLQETDRRLEQLQQKAAPLPGKTCLLHLLVPRRQGLAGGVELKTVRSRLLKRGGWGKCTDFDLRELTRYYAYYGPSEIALPQDKLIARLLSDPQQPYSAQRPVLEGDIGHLVLQRLLESGRCFFETPDHPPLSLGPGRRLVLDWKKDQGLTRLDIALEDGPEHWLLLPTSPAWYLDPKTHQCGPIEEQPLPSPLLASLAALPDIAEKQLLDLSHFLLEKFPPGALAPPLELNLKSFTQPPIPTLTLHSVADPTGDRHHLLRLHFAYGPHRLTPMGPGDPAQLILRQGEEDWRIQRHPAEEQQAALSLRAYNLTAASGPLATAGETDLLFATESLAASAWSWKNFLDEIPRLREQSWRIDMDESFVLDFTRVENLQANIEEGTDWFSLSLRIEHAGHPIELLPLVVQWLEEERAPQQPLLHPLGKNRWLEIPCALLEPVIATLVELFDQSPLDEAGQLQLPRTQAHGLLGIEQQLTEQGIQLAWQGGENIRQLALKLRDFQGIATAPAPQGLAATLRDYQQQGLSWLQFLCEYEFNGILADDMGLGKTIQTLSHLLLEKEAGRLDQPALIVAPTSVLSNWQREAARFTTELRCLVLHGPARSDNFDRLKDYDLIVTSYALLVRDLEHHLKQSYHSLILDEAQAIKNPRAQTALAAARIPARHRLCLTGTPLENHLGELWSLFHVLMPGFLGPQQQFTRLFRTPIERNGDGGRQQQLQQRIAPFVLRRTKEQVARELPPKTVMVREAELGSAQGKLYESLRLAMVKKVGDLLQRKGLAKSHIEILDALLKLRQACCDPRLVKLAAARKVTQSAKLDELMNLLPNLLEEGRKILIFSQFTSMLALIEEQLRTSDIGYSKLTGQTRKRDEAIAAFQDGPARVFLISLKAGGVGLNLTAADTVIHYDPWWNPAAENQATDRAHRIGQDKPVLVYKLVAKGTIEEKILQLQEKKQKLADGVYRNEGEKEPLAALDAEDILKLLTPLE